MMLRHRRRSLLAAVTVLATVIGTSSFFGSTPSSAADTPPSTAQAPTHLTVNDLSTPLAVAGVPGFGWLPQDSAGNETQTAYDIVVSDGLTGNPVWDSGKVASSAESYVSYGGPTLTDGDEYKWSVTTWNAQDQESPAAGSFFDTGIADNEWSGAQWIRRATTGNDSKIDYTLARNQFTLTGSSPVVRALVYLAAPMRSQLHVNGAVIDTQDDYQTAGENYYDTEDVTAQAVSAQQATGAAANQLAVSVQYAHWAAGEAHPEGPQPYASTLAAAAAAGATTVSVNPSSASTCTTAPAGSSAFCGANYDWYVGETLAFGTVGTAAFTTDTIAAISGNSVTLAAPLALAELVSAPVTSENGPSGLLAKVVVNYADGTSSTFVSDGSWLVTDDTAEQNTTATVRSSQTAGDMVEYYNAPNAQTLAGWDSVGYAPSSAWTAPVVMGTAPLPEPPNCANYSTSGSNTVPGAPASATGVPVLSSPCGFTHLTPLQAPVTYKIVHPTSLTTLADGTVEANFAAALVGVPVVRFPDATAAQANNQVTLTASYRPAGTVTTAAAAVGDTSITVDNTSKYPDFTKTGAATGFAVGDPITVDGPADGYGAGNPESDTISAINGAVVTLATPLTKAHAAGIWVSGSRVGTAALDDQTTNLNYYYTQSGTPDETTGFFGPMGEQYLQIYQAQAANGGQPLTTADVWEVEQYNAASAVGSAVDDPGVSDGGPDTAANVSGYSDTAADWNPSSVFTQGAGSTVNDAATFTSSNPELDAVFQLMERSALFSGQQAYEDSPDRQEGQFTGDGVDESEAQVETLAERSLTRQFIDNLIDSQQRWWIAGSAAQASTWGEISAIYPDNLSDNKRDIPDYSEMFGELVWNYYQETGDRATLAAAYPTMVNVAQYVTDSIYPTGQAAGLVCQLASFSTSSSYRYGIIDWPATDRYNTVVANAGVDTVINTRAVAVYRAIAGAAGVLGKVSAASAYNSDADQLTDAINATLVESNGLYDDGLTGPTTPCTATAGDALIGNHSQHDQSFAVVDGVAPTSSYPQLGAYIAAEGMKAGPMDVGQLEMSLVQTDQPAALVTLLTNTAGDGPAKILSEGGTSMWEEWDPGCSAPGGTATSQDTYNDTVCAGAGISQTSSESLSHGWGSVGVYPMMRGLVGITPSGVGASTVDITPPSTGLAAASGTEMTERGAVSVDWTQQSTGVAAGQDTLKVTVPVNVKATVTLPAGALPYVSTGAGAPQYVKTVGGQVVYTVGSGVTTFEPQSAAPTVAASPAAPTGLNGWYTGPVDVTISSTDDRDPAAVTQADVDDAGWVTVTGPITIGTDGNHTVQARTLDSNGNASATSSWAGKIDATPPVSSARFDTAGRLLSLQAADNTSGVAHVDYQVGSGPWQQYSAPVDIGTTAVTVSYRATDNAGNVEPAHVLRIPAAGVRLKASTTVAIVSPATAIAGTVPVVTARVSGVGSLVPSGSIVVTDGKVSVGRGTLSAGRATIRITGALAVGMHTLLVTYGGDGVFAGSTDTVHVQVVKAVSSVRATLSASRVAYGVPVKVTTTVRAPGLVPLGTVAVRDNGALVTVAALSKGSAVVKLKTPQSVGVHRIVVSYSGDPSITGSSTTVSFTVTKAKSTVGLKISPKKIARTTTPTVTVTVATTPTVPATGTVGTVVTSGSRVYARVTRRLAAGHVSFTLPKLRSGSYRVTTSYSGSATVVAGTAVASVVVR